MDVVFVFSVSEMISSSITEETTGSSPADGSYTLATTPANDTASLTINDNNEMPLVGLYANQPFAHYNPNSGGSVTKQAEFTFNLTDTVTSSITVYYNVAEYDTTNTQKKSWSDSVTIPANAQSAPIDISPQKNSSSNYYDGYLTVTF